MVEWLWRVFFWWIQFASVLQCDRSSYKFDDKTIFMKAVSSIILAEDCYWNSQHIYRGFTIAFDRSDSRTHPCHVRM